MSLLTILTLAAAVAAIPPPEFGFVDSANHTELSVAYTFNGNTTVVAEGQLFGANITSTMPTLALNPALYKSIADYQGQYLILMVDPDAPSPDDPSRRFILHWLATNMAPNTPARIPQTGRMLTNFTPAMVPYRGPGPPPTSSAHRYILYAFQQPDNFAIPAAFRGFSDQNRTNFNLDNFIKDAGLGRPAAGEYFYTSRQQGVPGDFIALPGGKYPGGNGNAIFANDSSLSIPSTNGTRSIPTSGGAPMVTATCIAGTVLGAGLLGLLAII